MDTDVAEELRLRAWIWKLLHEAYGPQVGAAGWVQLEAEVGAVGLRMRAHSDLFPSTVFAAALERLDSTVGRGDGAEIEAAGRRIAQRWAEFYAPLAAQLKGRPEAALELLRSTVLPDALMDRAAIAVKSGRDNAADVATDLALPAQFWWGLTAGFVEATGARATTRSSAHGHLHLSWAYSGRSSYRGFWPLAQAAVRLPFLVATLVPVLVGFAIAARGGPLDPLAAALTLVGVIVFQGAANALNDHYDSRTAERAGDITPRPHTRHLRTLAFALYGVGTTIGLALVVLRGTEILWLGLAGVLLGLLYSAPPIRLAHRGLGELAAAIGFGPLLVVGTHFAQRQEWSVPALLASFPLAIVIAAVLYINELPDREGDARVGKRTLIVRLPERSAVTLYVALHGLAYLLILGGVALGSVPGLRAYAFPPWSLLGLLTLPLAVRASLLVARNYRYPYRLVAANPAVVRLHLATGALFAIGYLVAGGT